MEHSTKIIKLAFSIILFCAGSVLLMYEAGTYYDMLKITREKVKERVVFQQYNTRDKGIISKAELMATLFGPLEYDITIDQRVIKKTEHKINLIPAYGITGERYRKTYQYDDTGDIILIKYTSIP